LCSKLAGVFIHCSIFKNACKFCTKTFLKNGGSTYEKRVFFLSIKKRRKKENVDKERQMQSLN